MKSHARKRFLVTAKLAALLSANTPWPAAAQNLNDTKETTLFLGPFTLAEIGNLGKRFEQEGGPDEAVTKAALAKCKFYLVDRRVRMDGKWEFSGNEEGYPKILVEGPLSFKLTDKKGKEVLIHVKEFVASRDFPKGLPDDSCRGTVGVTIIVYRDFDGGRSTEVLGQSRHLFYDTQGRTKGFAIEKDSGR